MSDWYPILLKVEGRKCVVIGGGSVAQRKSEGLIKAQAKVVVISPKLTPVLLEWVEAGYLHWVGREVMETDLDGASLVFAATNRPNINRWISDEAGKRAIPVNIADDGENGDFIVPSVLRRDELVLTVSASGASPALAARIIQELAQRYGPEYNVNVQALRAIRLIVKAEVSDLSERRELLQAAVTDEALEEWRSLTWPQDKAHLIARLRVLSKRVNDRKG